MFQDPFYGYLLAPEQDCCGLGQIMYRILSGRHPLTPEQECRCQGRKYQGRKIEIGIPGVCPFGAGLLEKVQILI
jgi:hypothetical protein